MSKYTLDARGLICPMPVLKAHRRLRELPPGAVLEVLATDKAALKDMPEFCTQTGHTLLHSEEQEGVCRFLIRKA